MIEQKEKQKLKCFAFTYIKTISWHICANLETVLRETKRSNHAQKLRAFLEQLERNLNAGMHPPNLPGAWSMTWSHFLKPYRPHMKMPDPC